jgi:membrane-bound lytic murein transglycosylase D
MKFPIAIVLLLVSASLAPAQTNDVNLGDLLDTAQQWAQENLDGDVLAALQNVDREKVVAFLNQYQAGLQGDSVLDVAQLKVAAHAILPLLDAHEETQPYAAWLRARLNYFDAAEELKKLAPLPPPGTNAPPPLLNPTFAAERKIWIKEMAPEPWPKGAEQFVPELKTIFAAERVPAALVWLAEVESGFDARARSPSGAVGLFQLMPATAKSFGLSLWPFDQRKQTEPAAQAAAKYLRQLHEKFGDWRLAVAAYNSGAGTVEKCLKRRHATSYTGIATYLPAETQMYVPKVEATILKREGVELEQLKTPPAIARPPVLTE